MVRVGDAEYCLRLTMRSLAILQEEYGQTSLLQLFGGEKGELPNFGACLRMIELALRKHHPDAGPDVADEIFTGDQTVVGRIIGAAFPDAEVGAGGKGKAARA